MQRIANFENSLNIANLSMSRQKGGVEPGELLAKLTRRVIYFHSVITQYQEN